MKGLLFVVCVVLCQTVSVLAQNEPNCLGPSDQPLVQAIRDGELDKARTEIYFGAKLNTLDQCGANPLWEAIRWNYTDFALELMLYGADPKFFDGGAEALLVAATLCNTRMAKELLKRGVGVNPNANGVTALMNAPSQRCKDGAMVQLLLDAGADPNARSQDGFNALLAAAETGDAVGAEKLLRAGADPAFKNKYGETAESQSCDRGEHGHYLVCQLVRQALHKQ